MAISRFYDPSTPKPQIVYNFEVDNSNSPFIHHSIPESFDPWFDPTCFVNLPTPTSHSPVKYAPIESTPFTFVQDLAGLHYLADKLNSANEFAVDLEHHSYRTFQGMTCLMQISTRTEDFIVDTLKLRAHIGEFLGSFFSDPTKKKVMHGAINDVIWLQRDFGIYVVNLFDTMQASRVLGTARNSLAFLLESICGVHADKQYQRSDWRVRPLPSEMVKYAREDTHYLLYIYDVMREELASGCANTGCVDRLGEVYRRSHGVCMRMYQKDVYDKEVSYLFVYGLGDADLDAKQLAIVAGLCEWRDKVAREEDESVGYVLPNKDLLEIAKMKPLTARELLELAGYSNPLVCRDVDKLVEIIWGFMCLQANKFEGVAQEIKLGVPVSEIAARHQWRKKKLFEIEEAKRRAYGLGYARSVFNPSMFSFLTFRSHRLPVVPAMGHY